MALAGTFYRLVGRRFSTLFIAVAGGTFVFDYGFNNLTNAFWDYVSFFMSFLIYFNFKLKSGLKVIFSYYNVKF